MEILMILFTVFFLSLFFLLLPLIAIIDIVRSRFYGNDNLLMLLIVIFIPFGSIIYFLIAPSRKIRV